MNILIMLLLPVHELKYFSISLCLLYRFIAIHIKTKVRYPLICIKMATIKKGRNNKKGEDVEKREPSYTVAGSVNWCSHYEKTV